MTAGPAPGGPVVLVVDDEPRLCQLLADVLVAEVGARVLSAGDGDAALRILRERHVDLMVLDVAIPRVAGAEVVRRVRADPATRGLPVVAMSARADAAPGFRGLVAAFLPKPFELDEFVRTVRDLLPRPKGRA